MRPDARDLITEITGCEICRDRFLATETGHSPRPVIWFRPSAKILIAGQAPGLRVHQSGTPFSDPSGDRLRNWMDVSDDEFYDLARVAIVPMAFCFPGYDAKGADRPPPAICAKTWRTPVVAALKDVRLTLLVGGYAQKWHLKQPTAVSQNVRDWRRFAPEIFPLPHPSWRNTGWLQKNPWFENDLLPELRTAVRSILDE